MPSATLHRLVFACVLAVAALLALNGCTGSGRAPPVAQVGSIDLRGWNFERDGLLPLDGQWEFLWQRLEPPDEPGAVRAAPFTLATVPAPWNDLALPGIGSTGFATYRLMVNCKDASGLALVLPVQHSAASVFVNGRLIASQGRPGESPQAAKAAVIQQIVHLPDLPCPWRVVIQVSNYEQRLGGLVRAIELGTQQQVHQRRDFGLTRDVFVLGVLMAVSMLPLVFFLFRRRDWSLLYFGLYGLSFCLYIGVAGEKVLQPLALLMGWNGWFKLVFVSWYLGTTMFALFLNALYPKAMHPMVVRAASIFGFGGALLALVTPTQVFTQTTGVLQLGSALLNLYLLVVLARMAWRRNGSAAILLAGLLVYAVCATHDILNYEHLLALQLAPWGMLAFVLAPAALLARRFARALTAEELRTIEQRERADLLLRSTNAGLVDWDGVTGQLTYSERYKQMLGYEPERADKDMPPFQDLVHIEDRDQVRRMFSGQLRDTSVKNGVRPHIPMDYRLRRTDGEYIWVHAEGIALCGADGRTLRFICSFIDISQAKRQEIELSNRVKFINDLFDSVPMALTLRDVEGRTLYVNRAWEHYMGASRDVMVGRLLSELARPDVAERALSLDREALALPPGVPIATKEYFYRKRRFLHNRTVMVDSEGRRIGVLVASVDTTDKYHTEQALAAERERTMLLLRATQAGFSDWDMVNNTTVYSERFKEMLGYPPDADTSDWPPFFSRIHPDDVERASREFGDMLRRTASTQERVHGPMFYRLKRLDGSYIWVRGEGIAQVGEDGATRRFTTSYVDITAEREQEEALRQSRDQLAGQAAQLEQQNETLKENVRLREEVERIGRHDIKTPLNSIIAVPRLLREERSLSREQDELLGIVERAGYRILSMVNLSLDLYKIENGSYIFRPDAVDLADLVDKVIVDIRSHAASKKVVLKVVNNAHPAYAWAEELLCYSLIANLLKNAVEASPENAAVTVSLERLAPSGDEPGDLLLRMHNGGTVPQAVRETFFQKYATAGKASGTGLGAYSARLMARVQDGDIAMNTSESAGTTITVRLRAAPEGRIPAAVRHAADHGAPAAAPAGEFAPLHVLLVDDDEYNLLIVRRYLPSPPLRVRTAINGRVALELAAQQHPDVVIMDLDMPVMGGLEAVGRMRELEQAGGYRRCVAVALSSHDDEVTRQRSLDAGFDHYLTKPVTREVIQQTLLALMRQAGMGQDVPGTVHPAAAGSGGGAAPPRDAAQEQVILVDAEILPTIAGFIESRCRLIDEMTAALDGADRAALRRAAHRLSGSLGLYGFHWAARHSRLIEDTAQEIDAQRLATLALALREHLRTVRVSTAREHSGA